MTTTQYKIEYEALLEELTEDRNESMQEMREIKEKDSPIFIELKKEVYVLNSIIARMESFLREEP